jgi:hypothetical protein
LELEIVYLPPVNRKIYNYQLRVRKKRFDWAVMVAVARYLYLLDCQPLLRNSV